MTYFEYGFNHTKEYYDLKNIYINYSKIPNIKFNLFQCKKIMNYFDTTTIFSNNTCFKNNKIWIEDTSVLSYFYIKTITLLNMDYFLKNILIKGSSASYFDFILNNGEKLEFFINKINIDSIRDKNLLSMMRMSLYNLKFNI